MLKLRPNVAKFFFLMKFWSDKYLDLFLSQYRMHPFGGARYIKAPLLPWV